MTKQEVYNALLGGKRSKTQGNTGIPYCLSTPSLNGEYYWILKKRGIIVLILNIGNRNCIDNYRPITLGNYYYKLLAWVSKHYFQNLYILKKPMEL